MRSFNCDRCGDGIDFRECPKRLPRVKECVAYIESTGWKFQYYNRPWYVFRSEKRETWAGNKELTFTLHELRDCKKNGW